MSWELLLLTVWINRLKSLRNFAGIGVTPDKRCGLNWQAEFILEDLIKAEATQELSLQWHC